MSECCHLSSYPFETWGQGSRKSWHGYASGRWEKPERLVLKGGPTAQMYLLLKYSYGGLHLSGAPQEAQGQTPFLVGTRVTLSSMNI